MTVRNIIKEHSSRKPPFCTPDMTVFDAAVEIAELGVNALAVVEDDKLAGIITDHDIIRALADAGSNLERVIVGEWMSPNVKTCTPDDKLSDALNTMGRYRIRHLVVVEGEKPIAVIGAKDVLTRVHENDELELRVLQDLARVTLGSRVA
jgi:CBS domain-containing protein